MKRSAVLTSPDGHNFSIYVANPSLKPKGVIIVVQEIFGVNGHIRQVSNDFAADGYLAIAPALFDRIERNIELGYSDTDIAKGRELRTQLALADVLCDLQTTQIEAAKSGKVGIVGYCFGGTMAWLAASRIDGIAAASSYYGGGIGQFIKEPARTPTIFHFGRKDPMIPLSDVEALRKAQPQADVYLYDADHGFNCDQRKSYDAPSAELARERTIAHFSRYIAN